MTGRDRNKKATLNPHRLKQRALMDGNMISTRSVPKRVYETPAVFDERSRQALRVVRRLPWLSVVRTREIASRRLRLGEDPNDDLDDQRVFSLCSIREKTRKSFLPPRVFGTKRRFFSAPRLILFDPAPRPAAPPEPHPHRKSAHGGQDQGEKMGLRIAA